MRLRLWFTDRVLFGHDSHFFTPVDAAESEELQRGLAMEAHRVATRKMDDLDKKMEEVTILACGTGRNGHV